MKYAIVGAGAIGSLIGHYLAISGQEVWFVDPFEAHMKAIEENGLIVYNGRGTVIEEGEEPVVLKSIKTALTPEPVGKVDVIILLVKGINTRSAIPSLQMLADENTLIISLQNGYGNTDILKEFFSPEQVAYGTINGLSALIKPGVIKGMMFGKLYIGAESKANKSKLEQIAAEFTAGGCNAEYREDIDIMVWSKISKNCANNALAAILHLDVNGLKSSKSAVAISNALAKEVQAVAKAKGIPLGDDDIERLEYAPHPGVPSHKPSTFQDVLAKRKTENDFLNGAIMREGAKYGVPTPFNTVIYLLIDAIENTYEYQEF
ncbi:MAG: ketopantoate reductase family protein [bacterium]|jgi:2-dehydropantoate 2-reductase